MTARVVEIADDLVRDLNGRTWSLAFVAQRRWLWFSDVAQIPERQPLVSVIPRDVEVDPPSSARRRLVRNYGLVLAVQLKLPSNTQSKKDLDHVDPVVELAQELWEFIEPSEDSEPVSPSGAEYVSSEHDEGSLYSITDLEARVFTSLVTFTFCDER